MSVVENTIAAPATPAEPEKGWRVLWRAFAENRRAVAALIVCGLLLAAAAHVE